MLDKLCKRAQEVEIDGKKYKVVDPNNPCVAVNKVLAKHEGSELISPKEYEALAAEEEEAEPQA